MLKTILNALIQIGLRNAARKRKEKERKERNKDEVRKEQNLDRAGTDGNGDGSQGQNQ